MDPPDTLSAERGTAAGLVPLGKLDAFLRLVKRLMQPVVALQTPRRAPNQHLRLDGALETKSRFIRAQEPKALRRQRAHEVDLSVVFDDIRNQP
ncbi:MAG TPA: hypothetical protein VGR06_22880 [Actinophytocola sp.]|uniref:hypothetical protein n=1 Tax=Actinophytocola sp. TaxID=1872138 RepID=UPI002E0684F2|nr:hypothetical protein [Actinophytocola sp.]